jgi:hypothetical protein
MKQLSQTTTDTTDQAEEEILTSTLSDEALEVAADTQTGLNGDLTCPGSLPLTTCM